MICHNNTYKTKLNILRLMKTKKVWHQYKKGNKNNNIYIKVYHLKRETNLEAIKLKDIEPKETYQSWKKRLTRQKETTQA